MMRIGLTGGGSTLEKIVNYAKAADNDGFLSLWYASNVAGDPSTVMAIAGRETSRIELGKAMHTTS